MLRRSLGLGICVVGLLASPATGQMRDVQGPRPSTVEPPLADDAPTKPEEPGHLEPAVFNQSVPLNPTPAAPDISTPVVTIQVGAPEAIAVGADATYKLTVQNRSQAKAHHVLVRCVTKNATLVKADPPPSADKPELQWQLETLNPGETKRIEVALKPNEGETELRVVGRVQFDHGLVVKTRVAAPGLSVKKLGPTEGVLYDNLTYRIEVVNTGKVAVSDVQVIDQLPEGLEFDRSEQRKSVVDLEKNRQTWTIDKLRPGEKQTLEYRLIAKKVGDLTSMTQVRGAGTSSDSGFKLTVREAKLTVQLTPPASGQAFVNQPAGFQVAVKNAGTAALNNVRVTCSFPSDAKLARASSGAQFFRDSVQWIVPKLAPGEGRTLTFHLTVPNAGSRKVTASVRADRGGEQTAEVLADFQGIAALRWETEGTPVASVGKEIKYTVTVTNTGSAEAGNVRVLAQLPQEVEFQEKANPTFRQKGPAIEFDAIQLPARRSATYTLTVLARRKGEASFRFELMADHMRSGAAVHQKSTTINGTPDIIAPPKDSKEPKEKKDIDRIGMAPAFNRVA